MGSTSHFQIRLSVVIFKLHVCTCTADFQLGFYTKSYI